MIIELQNFGPIKSFKFDKSKDMHVIFGMNNIGKSYAISAVYLVLKNLRIYLNNYGILESIDKVTSNLYKEVDYLSPDYIEYERKIDRMQLGDEVIRLSSNFELILKNILNKTFIHQLEASFKNTFVFENIQNQYKNHPLVIIINLDYISIKIGLCELKKNLVVEKVEIHDETQFILQKFDDKFYSLYGYKFMYSIDDLKRTKPSSFRICLRNFLHNLNLEFIETNFYFLPSSRSGLYNALNSFGAIFAELSRNRNFIRNKIEIPNIAEPISDYFLNLNTIDKTDASEYYLNHFEEIEQEILQGKINLDNETKKYYYTPNNSNMRLELTFTSSMISEIAPIIAHLKYIIPLEVNNSSIFFIEEPEAHLHPEIQILLIEYFVKLSKGNVKIVMTSHSNYIFNKLSNLIIATKISVENLSVSLMKMTNAGSVVVNDAMHMDEFGIEDNNFVDVAEKLYEERIILLENI